DWSVGGWYRNLDDGFSVSRFDIGQRLIEKGFEFSGELSEDLILSGLFSTAERGNDSYDQALVQIDWRYGDNDSLAAEVRRVTETRNGASVDGVLGAVRYTRRLTSSLEVYGLGQATLDNDGGQYRNNDLMSLGGKYLFGDSSSVGAEVTQGARGEA